MNPPVNQIFLSYSGEDSFVASLLQFAGENILSSYKVNVWSYQRDQVTNERSIGKSLKHRVQESRATIFIVSPSTLNSGAAQWMELAYSDAFEVPTFVILSRITFLELKSQEKGVPPLLLEGQCSASSNWRQVVADTQEHLIKL